MPSEVETAWLAGFLEGEGSFLEIRRQGARESEKMVIRVSASSVDRDVLERVQQMAGGALNGPYSGRGENDQPFSIWAIGQRAEAVGLMRAILPYMGERRAQRIRELLELSEREPRAACGRRLRNPIWSTP